MTRLAGLLVLVALAIAWRYRDAIDGLLGAEVGVLEVQWGDEEWIENLVRAMAQAEGVDVGYALTALNRVEDAEAVLAALQERAA